MKRITIYCSDGTKIVRKDGLLTSIENDFFVLDEKIMIPKSRIVRIEVSQ